MPCSSDNCASPACDVWRVQKTYYVYILSSQGRVLYIGMTSNIEQRVFQHKTHAFGGFTAQYNVTCLVYLERHGSVMTAIRKRKRNEGMAAGREDRIDRIDQSKVEGPELWMVSTPSLPAGDSRRALAVTPS